MEFIYKITNTINGKFYIGKTKNIERRWKEHLKMVGKKRHPLYDSILHYGKENFKIEIIDEGDSTIINEMEKEWILNTNSINIGYNIAPGGEGGDTFSNKSEIEKEVTRNKLREAAKIINAKNIDLHRSNTTNLWKNDDYRNKVIKKLTEIASSKEYREMMSKKIKKVLMNPEKIKKWSECKMGRKNGRWNGFVVITDNSGNEYRYESAIEASKKLKVAAQRLRNHCVNGTTYKVGIYKGWKFRYEI